jgi:hypothetical protein
MSSIPASGDARDFSREGWEWRRLVGVLLLVLWPSLAVIAAVEAVAWQVGETRSPDFIARWQSEKPGRMWRGGDGRSYLTYKVARIKLLKPQVIMLGQSRANSFTADNVQPYTFYNSGLTAWTFNQYLRFLQLINVDGYEPHVLFFNFDYWMFSAGFDRFWADRFYERPPTHTEAITFVLSEWAKYPITLLRRLPATGDLQGMYAVLSGDGFGDDGSLMFHGGLSADPKRLEDDGTGVGIPPVQLDDKFSPDEVAAFERFVTFAHDKNITLIGIQVPFFKKILDGLNNNPRAGIWREFRSDARRKYFESKGVIFFDFGDMPEYRDEPQHFIDSIHPDPVVFHTLLQRVWADPRVQRALPKVVAR